MAIELRGFTAEAVQRLSKNAPNWLKEFRLQAWKRFESTPWPQRNDEEWRRTDISRLDLSRIAPLESDGALERAGSEGRLKPEYLTLPTTKFAALTDAFFNGGSFIQVNQSAPIVLTTRALFPRTVIVVDKGASAFVVDTCESQEGFISAVQDVWLEEGAHLRYLRMQKLSAETNFFSTLRAHLKRGASLDLMYASTGGLLTKEYYEVALAEPESKVTLTGVVSAGRSQHFDTTAKIDHLAPHTTSSLTFKAAVRDKARSVFIGNIFVGKQAIKTDAVQQLRDLLLSRDARADSIPKLEILADDVKCAHGAAIGSVDEDQIFYLASRGLARPEAEQIIVQGFFEDVIGKLQVDDPIRDQVRTQILG